VELLWRVGAPAGFAAELYRCISGTTTCDSLGTLRSAADGSLTYTDRAALSEQSYDYRLGVMQDGREYFYGQTTVRITPATTVLSLAGARPNPVTAASAFVIEFSLTGHSAATLDLLDLSGRRVLSRELSAGSHSVTLDRGALRPGVYFVRLTQAGTTRNKRIVVL
jgi:hypothetical protein